MTLPGPGDIAPVFTLASDDGSEFDLGAERGHHVVLFFYPKDDTPGCTKENCDFSELGAEFAGLGVSILGISPDTTESHLKFRAKYGLRSRLAADPDHIAITAYGVWGEKQMAGRTYMGLRRTSFIIAPDGTIAAVFPVARVKGHAAAVLAKVRELSAKC